MKVYYTVCYEVPDGVSREQLEEFLYPLDDTLGSFWSMPSGFTLDHVALLPTRED